MNFHDLSYHVAKALLHSESIDLPEAGLATPPKLTITISREAGSRATAIAREAGRRLNWPVYDNEILDKVAAEMKRPTFQVHGFDERPVNWLESVLDGFVEDYPVSQPTYLKYLIGVIRGLGKMGHCIIVGRGAAQILPRESTLRVRVFAAPAERVKVLCQLKGMSPAEAKRWMETTDRERVAFMKTNFNADPTDPLHYDLLLNVGRLSVDDCAAIMVESLNRFESHTGVEAEAGLVGTAR